MIIMIKVVTNSHLVNLRVGEHQKIRIKKQ